MYCILVSLAPLLHLSFARSFARVNYSLGLLRFFAGDLFFPSPRSGWLDFGLLFISLRILFSTFLRILFCHTVVGEWSEPPLNA